MNIHAVRGVVGILYLGLLLTIVIGILYAKKINQTTVTPNTPSSKFVCDPNTCSCKINTDPNTTAKLYNSMTDCENNCCISYCEFLPDSGYTGNCVSASSCSVNNTCDTTVTCNGNGNNNTCVNAKNNQMYMCSGTSDKNPVPCIESDSKETCSKNPECEQYWCCNGGVVDTLYFASGEAPSGCVLATTTSAKPTCSPLPTVDGTYYSYDSSKGMCNKIVTSAFPGENASVNILDVCKNASNIESAIVTGTSINTTGPNLDSTEYCVVRIKGDDTVLKPNTTGYFQWISGTGGCSSNTGAKVLTSGWCPKAPSSICDGTNPCSDQTCGSCSFQQFVDGNCPNQSNSVSIAPMETPTECGMNYCPYATVSGKVDKTKPAYVPNPHDGGWGQCTPLPWDCSCVIYNGPQGNCANGQVQINGSCYWKCPENVLCNSSLTAKRCFTQNDIRASGGNENTNVASMCADWEDTGEWGCKCLSSINNSCSPDSNKYDTRAADGGPCTTTACVGCKRVLIDNNNNANNCTWLESLGGNINCERKFSTTENIMVCPDGGDCRIGDSRENEGMEMLLKDCGATNCMDKLMVCVSDPTKACQPIQTVFPNYTADSLCRFYNSYPSLYETASSGPSLSARTFLYSQCTDDNTPSNVGGNCQNPLQCSAN